MVYDLFIHIFHNKLIDSIYFYTIVSSLNQGSLIMVAVYCVYCRKNLKEYGEVAELVYDHICEWYSTENRAIEVDQSCIEGLQCRKPVIDFLEQKGLLVTTESGKDFIAIKPSSLDVIGSENLYFCSGRHTL